MSAALDAAIGDPYYTDSLPGDVNDTIKMAPFQPAIGQAAGESWWESIIKYGAVRAIDNRWGPTQITGNVQPGSFGGANGATYFQAPNATGQTLLGGGVLGGLPGWLLPVALIGAAAFLVLKK